MLGSSLVYDVHDRVLPAADKLYVLSCVYTFIVSTCSGRVKLIKRLQYNESFRAIQKMNSLKVSNY